MKRAAIAGICFLLVALGFWAVAAEKKSRGQAHGAVIIEEPMHSAEGVGYPIAISLSDGDKLRELEKFFPNYDRNPSSNTAAGWKAGYRVYFNFPYGRSVRVTVSGNDNGQTWSVGDGDFKTNGDFAAFFEKLKPKQGQESANP